MSLEIKNELVRSLLAYDPDTGVFIWRLSPRANVKVGRAAGALNSDGYRVIKLRRHGFMAHRLAWFYVFGVWPCHEIDHINGKRDDNRLANLRGATRAQNSCNVGVRRDNTSGRKGVTWHKKQKRWTAQIQRGGTKIHLGVFCTIKEAGEAYDRAATGLFGEYERRPA